LAWLVVGAWFNWVKRLGLVRNDLVRADAHDPSSVCFPEAKNFMTVADNRKPPSIRSDKSDHVSGNPPLALRGSDGEREGQTDRFHGGP
jgi:hypothetical protein